MITSAQNPLIQHLVKLRSKKEYRQSTRRVVISGLKLISELGAFFSFKTLIVQEGFTPPPSLRADQVQYVTVSLLKKITGLEQPEPLAAELDAPCPQDLQRCSYLLILDRVTDPGNLGTLFRSALALNWDGVFMTEGCVDPFNDKALRAAKGATFFLPFQVGSYEQLQQLLEHRAVFVADAKGKNVDALQTHPPLALILGNESHGPSSSFCYEKVGIVLNEKMESLNVAIAGAILMEKMHGKR